MLGKLLKYDLKYMLKSIGIFYILSIFFAIITRILFSLEQTVVINIIGKICEGCLFSMLASTLINTIMRSWVRFKDSIYGDESYLTHTLPVSKSNIYQSKFLLTLIYELAGFAIIVIGLFIAFYTKDRWIFIKNAINQGFNGVDLPTWLCIASIVLVLFLEIFNAIQSGYLGMIIGYKKENNKLGLSILFGFIIYTITQNIILGMFYILGLFNKDIMALFTSQNITDINILKTIIIFVTFSYVAISLLMNLICVKKLEKGVNVE